jgi:hypothetical protein
MFGDGPGMACSCMRRRGWPPALRGNQSRRFPPIETMGAPLRYEGLGANSRAEFALARRGHTLRVDPGLLWISY